MKKTQAEPTNASLLSGEAFYLRSDGTRGDDWIHDEILNNPEADAYFRECAIRSAIKEDRLTREQAETLYG